MNLIRSLAWPIAFATALAVGTPALAQNASATAQANGKICTGEYSCIGMVIDSGDPVLVQMGREMSDMVTDNAGGTVVKPTEGPIANVLKMLSPANAGLSVVPSDMLLYAARSEDPRMWLAEDRLRFVMSIGRKVVHVIAKRELKSLADLDRKRVVMGPDNTALWVVSNNLLHLHDAKPAERIQMKPPAGIKALLANEADAVFVVGDIPMKPVQKFAEMLSRPENAAKANRYHIIEIELPETRTEYQPAVLNYPGFAEGLKTVAILPTLISYDFTHKSSPYFRRRCGELTEIGSTVRARLTELRKAGHKQWNATKWDLEAGNWTRDECFFRGGAVAAAPTGEAELVVSREVRSKRNIKQAQKILNRLGYKVGRADGILGPKTSAALKKFQADLSMTPNGEFSVELLEILHAQEEALQMIQSSSSKRPGSS